mgnify:CR=1 FL=1
MMRVITGSARGRRLETLPGEDVTRPTTESVKEALFSMIQFDIEGRRVLDLFAGSGQLGIEALSRGARSCTFVENNRGAKQVVERNLAHCRLEEQANVVFSDAVSFLNRSGTYDLVLLDPPFRGGTLEKILPAVEKCVAPGGIVLCESETGIVLPAQAGSLTLQKQYKYGKVLLWKYTKPMQSAAGQEGEAL